MKKIFTSGILSRLIIAALILIPNKMFGQWNLIYGQDTLFNYTDVCITSDSTVYVCGISYSNFNSSGIILKSQDFGNTWSSTAFPFYCKNISFPTAAVGYVIVYPESIYKTIDSGNTWNLIIDTLDINRPENAILFLNADTGFVSSQDNSVSHFRTFDGGISWEQIIDSSLGAGMQLIGGRHIVFNNDNLYLTGGNSFLKSSDYGDNWEEHINNSIYNTNRTIAAWNDTIWMAGQGAGGFPHYNYGIISKSTDGGLSWSVLQYQPIHSFYDMEMVTDQKGYLVSVFYDSAYAFMKTINGGINWFGQQWTGNNQYGFALIAINCMNDSTGFAVGTNGCIFRTTNGGGNVNVTVSEIIGETNFNLYPNPSSGNFTITFPNTITKGVIEIYNVMGEKIFEEKISNVSQKEIHLKNINAGIYFLELNTDGERMVRKILKQ